MQIVRRIFAASAVAALALTTIANTATADDVAVQAAQSGNSVAVAVTESGVSADGAQSMSNKANTNANASAEGGNAAGAAERVASGVNPDDDADSMTPQELEEAYAAYLGASLKVDVSKKRVTPGEEIEFTVSDKDLKNSVDRASFTVEVHSKVYKLGEFTKQANKPVVVKWKVPADMAPGAHKVIVPEAKGLLLATFEVVKAADSKDAKAGKLAKTGAYDVAGYVGVALAIGAGALILRRRLA